jgi:hypothetical protein
LPVSFISLFHVTGLEFREMREDIRLMLLRLNCGVFTAVTLDLLITIPVCVNISVRLLVST